LRPAYSSTSAPTSRRMTGTLVFRQKKTITLAVSRLIRAAARLFPWRVEKVLGPTANAERPFSCGMKIGAIHVEANSRVVVDHDCRHWLSTKRCCDELPRVQKIRCIESDRKSTKQMPRQTERSSELPLPLRQVVGISVSRLTPTCGTHLRKGHQHEAGKRS
jgi:hypothetical protein